MALVKCKQCGNDVATNAAACPKCGAPVAKKSSVGKILLFVFGGLAAMCFIGTCVGGAASMAGKGASGTSASAGDSKPAEAPKQVDIKTLLREYADNEVRADSSFKGQVILTSGVVDDVKKDITNSIYVTVGTGKQFEIPQVQCFFDDEHAAKAAALSKGAKVGIRGRVSGLMMNVVVRDCEFVDL